MPMTCGERIKAARKAAGITQAELASRLNVSAAMLSQWETNSRNPKAETLHKIADALGCSFYTVAGFDEAAEYMSFSMREEALAYKESLPHYYQIQKALSEMNPEGIARLALIAEDLAQVPKYQAKEK